MSGTGVRGVDHFVMGDETGQGEISLKQALIGKLNNGGEITIEQTADDNELVVKENDMSGFTEEQLAAIRQVRAELDEKRRLSDAGSQLIGDEKKSDEKKDEVKSVPEKSSKSKYFKYAVVAALVAGGAMFWYSRRNKKKG